MAYTAQPTALDIVAGKLQRIGSAILAAFDMYAEAVSRKNEISFLNSLTDEELAARGLTRDRIVHHVFRDRLGA